MKRMHLSLAFLCALAIGCKGGDGDAGGRSTHGPAYTPVVANQLKALAGECEIRKHLVLCQGRQAMVNIMLDGKRNLKGLDIIVWAPLFEEAEQLIRLAVQGLVPEAAVKAISERLQTTKSDRTTIDGVRIDAYHTQAAKENPRYRAEIYW